MAGTGARIRLALLFGGLATAWGFNYVFVHVGLQYWPPVWLAASRATLGLAGVALLLQAAPRHRRQLDAAGRRAAILIGVPNTAIFFGLWFVAAASVLPGEAAVVVYTFPLWVALLGWRVLAHRPSRGALLAIGVGFLGVALITEPWRTGGATPPLLAILELLGGAVAWATGTVLFQRRFRPAEMLEANLYQLVGGSGTLLVAALALEPIPLAAPAPLLGTIVYLGIIGTAASYTVWFSLLSRMRAATLSAYVFLVPVVALTASLFLFHEQLDVVQAAGVLAVLASIWGTGRTSVPLEEPAG